MTDLYREEVLEHYHYPHNARQLNDPDTTADVANPVCGDRLTCQLKVDPEGRIKEVAFWGEGCVLSLAAASILSDQVKGSSTDEWLNMDPHEFSVLIGLPDSSIRTKCLLLSLRALQEAIADL